MEGVAALSVVLAQYVTVCPKTKIILLGFSQGAHVIADVMCGASSIGFLPTKPSPSAMNNNIAAVVLMGDPSTTKGQPFHVGSSVGNGIFPRQKPEGCQCVSDKTVSFCDAGDPFCEAGGHDLRTHMNYVTAYGHVAVDYAFYPTNISAMISFMLVLSFLMVLVSANSTTDAITCAKGAHLIVARGSLEPEGPGAMGILAEEIIKLIPGSDMEALVYPALYNEYVESQTEGVRTMNSVINNYVKNCPDTGLILMGYSQGAHVTMDTMCGASSEGFPGTLSQPSYITDNVAAIIAMGDPSLTEGQPFLVGTSEGSGLTCPRSSPATSPIGCNSIASKTVSICDKGDPYCEAGGKDLSVHLSYIKNYGEFTVGHVVKAWKSRN
ncbi:Cutinase/acetylxylan esterase [Fusarium oxysporum f. sp. vasinfectum]|nr:Cutinase/acetylxylan esterase [Fusarium oxysporum f. sp. vasinfectum]